MSVVHGEAERNDNAWEGHFDPGREDASATVMTSGAVGKKDHAMNPTEQLKSNGPN